MSALNSGSSGSQRPVSSSNSVSLDHQLWTTKYAPTNTSQIIGNPGAVKSLRLGYPSGKRTGLVDSRSLDQMEAAAFELL